MTIGEGLAGALYWKSFVDIAKEIGFSGPYLITSRNMSCDNEEFAKILGIKLINLYLNSIYIVPYIYCEENENTKRKTKSDLVIFRDYLASINKRRDITLLPYGVGELQNILMKFILAI
jgi:hypothetical protein